MNQNVHTTKILFTNPNRIPKGCSKSVIHSLRCNTSLPLPPRFSDNELADHFNTFFTSKISKIRLGSKDCRTGSPDKFDVNDQTPPCMDHVEALSQEEVENIINTSPSKSCETDPIPTTLLKEILLSVIIIFSEIINKLLTSGIFPESIKEALVKPLLKKVKLDLIEKSYRPVSNIEFIGKSIERAATILLTRHITSNNLIEPYQSAY